jgi:hypothetical protein
MLSAPFGKARPVGFERHRLELNAMNIVKGTSEFISGLQNIERDIIAKVREAGGTIDANNFKWHRGKELVPPPRVAIELEITVQGKSFSAALSFEQIVDSWQRIDRADVKAGVRNAVAALTKQSSA